VRFAGGAEGESRNRIEGVAEIAGARHDEGFDQLQADLVRTTGLNRRVPVPIRFPFVSDLGQNGGSSASSSAPTPAP
jgi:hypothetical protein